MKKSFILIIISVLVFIPFFNIQPASALTISQLNVELVARPGETIDQLVQLYDESLTGATVYPVVYNFTEYADNEGAALILTDPADLKPSHEWIQWDADAVATANSGDDTVADSASNTNADSNINTDSLESAIEGSDETVTADSELAGYGQEELPLTMPSDGTLFDFPYKIIIPQDAEPGSHLISLVFQTRPAENTATEGSAVYIGSNVAANIFLKVLGTTIDDIDVEFKAGTYTNDDPKLSPAEKKEFFEPKTLFLKPPVDFLVTMINGGNTHQKPDGNIKIINDLFGSRIEEIQVNELNMIILPDTDRVFEVDSYGQGFMFGKYRAKITLLYGDPLRPVGKEISFWIVPLVEILIALAILIIIITTIIIIRKRGKKKREKREEERDKKIREEIMKEMKGDKAESKETPVQKDNKQNGKQDKSEKEKQGIFYWKIYLTKISMKLLI